MKITYKKPFIKEFQKLKKGEQTRVKNSIMLFKSNIFHPRLKNHALHGKFEGYRSLNAGGDLRLIFREKDGYIEIIFLDLGPHSSLY